MTLLLTLEALDLESALMKLRCQNSSSLAHGGLERGRAAQGWMGPGGWTPGWTACAIITHGCCASAGMLLLPHGTRLHLRRVFVCLPGARTTADYLVHAGGQRRQQGAATALLVSTAGRAGGCCGCGLRLCPQPTHMHTWSSLKRPLGLCVRACRCYAHGTNNPTLYLPRSTVRGYPWRKFG